MGDNVYHVIMNMTRQGDDTTPKFHVPITSMRSYTSNLMPAILTSLTKIYHLLLFMLKINNANISIYGFFFGIILKSIQFYLVIFFCDFYLTPDFQKTLAIAISQKGL